MLLTSTWAPLLLLTNRNVIKHQTRRGSFLSPKNWRLRTIQHLIAPRPTSSCPNLKFNLDLPFFRLEGHLLEYHHVSSDERITSRYLGPDWVSYRVVIEINIRELRHQPNSASRVFPCCIPHVKDDKIRMFGLKNESSKALSSVSTTVVFEQAQEG